MKWKRNDVWMTATRDEVLGKKTGGGILPTVDELRAALKQHMKDHYPERLELKIEYLFKKHGIRYNLILTPPYFPKSQPMEEVWGDVKGFVGSEWKPGRTVEETRDDVLKGFYGGDSRHQFHAHRNPVDGANFIESTKKFLNTQVPVVGVISGTVDDLQRPGAFIVHLSDTESESDQFDAITDDEEDL